MAVAADRISDMDASRLADAAEIQRRYEVKATVAHAVRALAASASPRIRPDRSAIAKELKELRAFPAHQKMKALALDVELIDTIIELLGG